MFRAISVVDVLSCEEARQILLSQDETAFYTLLNDIGFDLKHEVDYEVCLHRPMVLDKITKTPVETGRWIGTERRDDWWLRSEHCSMENRLEMIGKKDVAFQKELLEMNRRPNFTAMACDYLADNAMGG